MVGFGRCSASGASEVLEMLARVLLSAWIPSGGGAPWSFSVPRATFRSQEIDGFLRLWSPRPDPGAADLGEIETEVVRQFFAAALAASVVVSSEAVLETSRLPRGGLRRSKVWGAWAAARQRQLPSSSSSPGSSDLLNIFLVQKSQFQLTGKLSVLLLSKLVDSLFSHMRMVIPSGCNFIYPGLVLSQEVSDLAKIPPLLDSCGMWCNFGSTQHSSSRSEVLLINLLGSKRSNRHEVLNCSNLYCTDDARRGC